MIQRAAGGSGRDREEFARLYAPVIRAYLGTRWRGTAMMGDVDDATQDVFLQCFKEEGALGRAEPDRPSGFRGFLYGVVRNVARIFERDPRRRKEAQPISSVDLDRFEADEEPLSQVFDRAWASAVLREAAAVQYEHAVAKGPDAVRRHELLLIRYRDDLPIREIAKRWDVEPAWLHGQFRRAREEFKRALIEAVRARQGGETASVEAECERLLGLIA